MPARRLRPELRELGWFLLFAFVLIAAGMGLRDPWPSDEPRFTLVARQMVESGQWLIPQRGSDLYSDKPPMLFWLEGAAFKLTGSWRIAFLLPSLLASLGTLWLTWDLGRRLWSPRAGLWAAGAVLFAFQFTYQAKRAQIDPLVVAWITLANWGLLLHFLRGPAWPKYWLGCFAAGLGVITKGVGALALLMFLPFLYARWRGWPDVLRERAPLRWLAGFGLFLLPVVAWGGAVLVAAAHHGTPEYQAYVDDLFLRQTAGRYAASWDHHKPFWYFLPVIALSWLPLALAWPQALARWRNALRARDARILLPLGWSAMLLVFFSIPDGKRDVYLMPALPMMALAVAPWLEDIARGRWVRGAALALGVGVGLVAAAVALWVLLADPPQAARFLEWREPAGGSRVFWWLLLAIGASFLVPAALLRFRRGLAALLAGLTLTWMIWSLGFYPQLNASSSAAGVMARARVLAGPDTEIGLVAWKEQNLLMLEGPRRDFGFQKPWPEQYREAAEWLQAAPAQRRMFVLGAAMGECVDRARAAHLGHANRRDWWLVGADALVPGCVPPAVDDNDGTARQPRSTPAHLVQVPEQVGRVLENPVGTGTLQLLAAGATGEQSDAERACPLCREHVPDRIADHADRVHRHAKTLLRGDEQVRVRLGAADLVAGDHRGPLRVDPKHVEHRTG